MTARFLSLADCWLMFHRQLGNTVLLPVGQRLGHENLAVDFREAVTLPNGDGWWLHPAVCDRVSADGRAVVFAVSSEEMGWLVVLGGDRLSHDVLGRCRRFFVANPAGEFFADAVLAAGILDDPA